ncbi:MAG TPA: polysaccharide biosynthesis tyrosine autokinase [Solirubrobacteraceae bacterium]|nr:polysaccharide biosynthesis tyrosine autokinase [Solirubrobacteraceae bacterium]
MKDRSTLDILWRRRWVVVATFLVFVIAAAIVSKTLPKVYSATSSLVVIQKENAASFDAVQASQVTARTYSDIISSSVIANQVASQLKGGETGSSVSSAISVSPVTETQLLKITADDHNPHKAQLLANTYASAVIEYIRQNLGSTVGAEVALASSATLPTAPSRPRPTLYVLVAAILGLFFGVGGALLWERLDTRLRTADEVRERFDELILARMPRRGRTATSVNAFNEAFGLLRANLQFASPDRPARVIAVTSAREGEGKTTCVAQMAQAMAEVDSRVIAIDADFRRPSLQKAVLPERVEPLHPGLSNYLLDDCSLEEMLHATETDGVEFVPTGPLPPSPAAVLESSRLAPVLQELADRADLVVLDCPPVSAGADASIIAGRVDGVVIVVDLERSDERSVRDVLHQLQNVHAPVLGFVLNRDRSIEFAYDYARVA